MNYMCCDKCGSEFVIKDSISTTLQCPDCTQSVELELVSTNSSRYYNAGYVDRYVDFDMDNYGYND